MTKGKERERERGMGERRGKINPNCTMYLSYISIEKNILIFSYYGMRDTRVEQFVFLFFYRDCVVHHIFMGILYNFTEQVIRMVMVPQCINKRKKTLNCFTFLCLLSSKRIWFHALKVNDSQWSLCKTFQRITD